MLNDLYPSIVLLLRRRESLQVDMGRYESSTTTKRVSTRRDGCYGIIPTLSDTKATAIVELTSKVQESRKPISE